jgi:hypothetical protein
MSCATYSTTRRRQATSIRSAGPTRGEPGRQTAGVARGRCSPTGRGRVLLADPERRQRQGSPVPGREPPRKLDRSGRWSGPQSRRNNSPLPSRTTDTIIRDCLMFSPRPMLRSFRLLDLEPRHSPSQPTRHASCTCRHGRCSLANVGTLKKRPRRCRPNVPPGRAGRGRVRLSR